MEFEECDDGNVANGDGCDASCNLESKLYQSDTVTTKLLNYFAAIDRKLDINIFIDSSFSMPFMQYPKVKAFLKQVISKMNLNDRTGVKVCYSFYFLLFLLLHNDSFSFHWFHSEDVRQA